MFLVPLLLFLRYLKTELGISRHSGDDPFLITRDSLIEFFYVIEQLVQSGWQRPARNKINTILKTYSSCTPQVSASPPVISFSCIHTSSGDKDTVRNIRATQGFTVNIISEPWIHQANVCSIDSSPNVSEWSMSGLRKEPSVSLNFPFTFCTLLTLNA